MPLHATSCLDVGHWTVERLRPPSILLAIHIPPHVLDDLWDTSAGLWGTSSGSFWAMLLLRSSFEKGQTLEVWSDSKKARRVRSDPKKGFGPTVFQRTHQASKD